MFDYSIAEITRQDILPKLSERMKYKDLLAPYIKKIYKSKYDSNFLLSDRCKDKIKNFEECGTNLLIDENGHITGANFCKQRLCPVCNYRRSTLMWHKINEIVGQFKENQFVFITLTVKNCKDVELNNTINHILQSFRRITNRKTWQKNFIGYVRGLEITYNSKENTYHPHIHILAVTSEEYYKSDYVDIHTLRKWWTESAELDYFVQVNIEAVKDKKKAVAEVAKYAVKMSSVLESGISSQTLRATQIIASCIENRRLIATGGAITKAAQTLKINLENDEDFNVWEARKSSSMYLWNGGEYELVDLKKQALSSQITKVKSFTNLKL